MGRSQKADRLFGRTQNGHGKEKKGQAQKEERRRTNNNSEGGSKLADVVAARRNEWDYSVFSAGENYSGQENAVGQAPSDSSSSAFAVLPTVTTTPATETDHAQRAAEIAHLHSHYQQDPTRARLLDIYKAHITELTEMQVEQMREDASAQRETLQIRAQTQDLMKWHRESVGFFAKEISRDIILGLQGGQQGD